MTHKQQVLVPIFRETLRLQVPGFGCSLFVKLAARFSLIQKDENMLQQLGSLMELCINTLKKH